LNTTPKAPLSHSTDTKLWNKSPKEEKAEATDGESRERERMIIMELN
jgi:hypothetical protein